MFNYYIKHKNAKNWSKLSLKTKSPIGDDEALAYLNQYAVDREKDPTEYQFLCVDSEGVEQPYSVR